MSKQNTKWNPPGYPWELELITFCFFLLSIAAPYYFHHYGVDSTASQLSVAGDALAAGRSSLSTTFGFLVSAGIIALYVFHFVFTFMYNGKITASPLHLFSPCAFAVIAYYNIYKTGGYQGSALDFIDGSLGQVALLIVLVGLLTSVFTRLRAYRYMLKFDGTTWDLTSPAVYDSSYLALITQLNPLIYAPRRYRACNDGIVIEGWFYAKPISFNDVHSLSRIGSSGMLSNGAYFASSTHHLVRLELHDSTEATYISPRDRDEFVRYCAQRIARKAPSHKASPTHHGMTHASDTSSGTAKGTAAGKTNTGAGKPT